MSLSLPHIKRGRVQLDTLNRTPYGRSAEPELLWGRNSLGQTKARGGEGSRLFFFKLLFVRIWNREAIHFTSPTMFCRRSCIGYPLSQHELAVLQLGSGLRFSLVWCRIEFRRVHYEFLPCLQAHD